MPRKKGLYLQNYYSEYKNKHLVYIKSYWGRKCVTEKINGALFIDNIRRYKDA
jgi:hypothetical protein